MTSCITSACLVDHNKLDIDAVYISLSRCGLDEESFNALFQFLMLAADGTEPVRAYALYCSDVRQQNSIRAHLKRRGLSLVTLTTMFDLFEEYKAVGQIAQCTDPLTCDGSAIAEAIKSTANYWTLRFDAADTTFVEATSHRDASIIGGRA